MFDPKYVFWLGVIVSIELGIGQGVVPLSDMFPADWVHFIKGWSAGLAFVGTTIMTALSGYSSKIAGPLVKSVAFAAIAASLALFGVDRATAADLVLPVKLPAIELPASSCTPTSCSGFYVGGALGGVGSNADIVGNGINGSVFAGGGIPMLTAGYQYASGNWFFGAEVAAGWQVSTRATIGTVSGNENGFISYQIGKVGGNLAGLFGNSSSPIAIPPKLANALISPYLLLGAVERPFATGWASGAGATFDIGPHTFVDIKYMYVNYGPSSNGAFNLTSENLLTAGVNYKF